MLGSGMSPRLTLAYAALAVIWLIGYFIFWLLGAV